MLGRLKIDFKNSVDDKEKKLLKAQEIIAFHEKVTENINLLIMELLHNSPNRKTIISKLYGYQTSNKVDKEIYRKVYPSF